MDPVTVIALGKVYQQEILENAAKDRWGTPVGRNIMEHLTYEVTAHLRHQAARELFAGSRPFVRLRHLFASLVSAAKAVDTRQSNGSVVCADPCAVEGE